MYLSGFNMMEGILTKNKRLIGSLQNLERSRTKWLWVETFHMDPKHLRSWSNHQYMLVQDFIRCSSCIDLWRRRWDIWYTMLGDSNRWRGSNKYSNLLTRSIFSTVLLYNSLTEIKVDLSISLPSGSQLQLANSSDSGDHPSHLHHTLLY